ncbi:MAG: hypothetical protein NZL83_02180, partial [Candidatus Absconditabacterales bacterium]|nr:hypothetical protein [Candidatus Absconditabacterales bacterium]
ETQVLLTVLVNVPVGQAATHGLPWVNVPEGQEERHSQLGVIGLALGHDVTHVFQSLSAEGHDFTHGLPLTNVLLGQEETHVLFTRLVNGGHELEHTHPLFRGLAVGHDMTHGFQSLKFDEHVETHQFPGVLINCHVGHAVEHLPHTKIGSYDGQEATHSSQGKNHTLEALTYHVGHDNRQHCADVDRLGASVHASHLGALGQEISSYQ